MPAPRQEGPEHDNPLAREQWFRRGRTVPGKRGVAASLLYHAYRQKLQLRAAHVKAAQAAGFTTYTATTTTTTTSGYGGWVPLGPAPINSNATGSLEEQDYGAVTGRATSVVADPGDPTGNTVYLGGAFGGLWKSTNAAAASPSAVTWTPLIDQQATLAVGAVALQPSTGPSQVILVGTGEANFSIDSYYGLGILRSADAGATWNLITSATNASLSGLAFAKIAFSTDNPNLVVAAATVAGNDEGASNNASSNAAGLYASTDAGQTWSLSQAGLAPLGASSVIYDSASHKFFAVLQFDGYYVSSDGMTWRRLASQPGTTLQNCPVGNSGLPVCNMFRGELAVVPGREELYTWYVTIDNQGNIGDGGIYKSTNAGASWTELNDGGITSCGDGPNNGCGVDQGWYNLTLAAVPNGAGTDLYAGTINIYKCSINGTNTTCGVHPFINLTHAYGCSPLGSLAHVHPDQHGMSFVRVSPSQVVMYFANDGGIYRALNGYALKSGTCGTAPNPFQSLNGTMGSMAEFVDFSNAPTDSATVLGGTQDNGSPATNASFGSSWISVNGGDGGFNLIDPNSPDTWYTSNTDVSVQRCTNGINCLAQTFDPIVTNSTVGGDHGFFYTPFILDPQSGSRMMVGTCRLWRGNNDGSGFAQLSYNLDAVANQSLDQACTGNEGQLIRSIAAGGPTTGNGSSVIYVGTEGGFTGTNTFPIPGSVWVTNNADLGPFTWAVSVTPTTGPYPISSIIVDPKDSTGNTAYETSMGFGSGNIGVTHDQGVTWSPAGFQLPDAPINAILLDPDDSTTVYVGTDVGVYTSHDLQSWTELGQLPNVPVLQLHMFESGGVKQLRAGTYGRGIWSYDIPYQIRITTPHIDLFPGQAGTIEGVVTAFNGYTSPVDIECAAPVNFGTCTGTTVTPMPSGTPFSLTITPGTTAFDNNVVIQGTGSDPAATVETGQAALKIADYNFSANTSSISVDQGATSSDANFYLSGFFQPITLSCSNLPPGASCNFYPSATVPAFVGFADMSVAADSTTPPGTYTITVSANTSGQPAPKTAHISLTVGNSPDFSMTVTPPGAGATLASPAVAQVVLTPVGGYSGPVSISCSVDIALFTCSLSPPGPITLAGAPVTVTTTITTQNVIGPSPAGIQTGGVTATGPGTAPHSVAFQFPVMDFALTARESTSSVRAGQTGRYELVVSPVGPPFTGPVSFSCSGLPTGSACSFSPPTVTPNSGPAFVVLSVSTSKVSAALKAGPAPASHLQLMLALLLPGMVVTFSGGLNRKRTLWGMLLLVVLCAVILQPACGGGGTSAGPPPPPAPASPPIPVSTYYSFMLTGTSGGVQHQIRLFLDVASK